MHTMQEGTKTILALTPQTLAASANGLAVDRQGFNEVLFLIGIGAIHADTVIAVKMQECATSGGTYADVTGATIANIVGSDDDKRFELYADLEARLAFVRLVFTLTGATQSSITSCIAVLGKAHNLPQS